MPTQSVASRSNVAQNPNQGRLAPNKLIERTKEVAGTLEGGQKARDTNKRKYGDDYYKVMGSAGGKKSRTGGTYGRPEWAKQIGHRGGMRGKRGYKIIGDTTEGIEYIELSTGKVVLFKQDGTMVNNS